MQTIYTLKRIEKFIKTNYMKQHYSKRMNLQKTMKVQLPKKEALPEPPEKEISTLYSTPKKKPIPITLDLHIGFVQILLMRFS